MALKTIVAPSILSSDFARLAEECARMKECGADWLHVDCMDGHFVPNLTIGAPVVKSLRKHTNMYIDCHLMVTNPSQWVDDFSSAGADGLTFHLETFCPMPYDDGNTSDVYECVIPEDARLQAVSLCTRIRDRGMRVGVALRPRTAWESASFLVKEGLVDMLLLMTVEPGFGGQKFNKEVMPKVRAVRNSFPSMPIEVDGGISPSTVATAVDAGANVLVAGSAVFGAEDAKRVIECLRNGGNDANS